MRIELSEGNWAELREPERITESGRRSYKIAVTVASDAQATAEERATARALSDDWMIAMFVEAWSYGEPLPCAKVERLRELSTLDYDALQQAIVASEMLEAGELKAHDDETIDPTDPSSIWVKPPRWTPSLIERIYVRFTPPEDVMEESTDMGAPFLAAGNAEVGAGGKQADDPVARGVEDLQPREADRVVTG